MSEMKLMFVLLDTNCCCASQVADTFGLSTTENVVVLSGGRKLCQHNGDVILGIKHQQVFQKILNFQQVLSIITIFAFYCCSIL